ncbi:MAG TPA: NTP transferase domain-containing protein [Euzebyales bacterium]
MLLAAGSGSRFGRPKALVAFHGEPLVRRGVRLLTLAGCAPVVVVVGASADAVTAVLADTDVTVVHNPDWASGMGGSFREGLAAARRSGAPAAVVALVDQPLVAPDVVRDLIRAWRGGAVVAVATYGGAQRTPVVLDAASWDAAAASAVGDRGARALLRERPEWVQPVPCDTRASPRDIDTEADLHALSKEPDPNQPTQCRRSSGSKGAAMELKHTFTVPVSADAAFEVLTDIERIAPCMPGASVDSVDGDEFTGTVKVKVGPMQVTYRGKASYTELDRDNYSAVIEARAQETRGSGTANATISASLEEQGDEETEVNVVSNLAITGRPAQFGRGVMNEVGSKLIGRFAECLSTKLSGDDEAAEEAVDQPAGTPAVGSNGSSAAASDQAITQQVGAAPPQPASGAAPAAAAAAPSAAAATSGATPAGSTAESGATDTHAGNQATTPKQTSGPDVEAIDLFEVAGPSIIKRAAPVAAVLLLLFIIVWRRRS